MDEPDFSKLPYIQQLRGALKVLMNHADNGVIHGGSVPEFLMHQLKIVPHRARIISEDLKALGLRRTDRDGKRHTHFIIPPVSGDITAEDMAKLDALKEQKKTAKVAGKSKPTVKAEVVTAGADDPSDIDTLLKAIELLEEGAETTRKHVETLNSDVKSNSERADKAEAKVRELEGLNAELNRKLEELKQSSTASDPRVQAIRKKYLV